MARGHTHVLGLDIGSSAIKAVELQRTGSGVELLGRPMIVPTPEGSVEGGVIVNSPAVADALTNLTALAHFNTKQAIVSVGGDNSVVVRITEVPKMTGKELDEAIQWELDRQTPFPIEQTFYDYQPIEAPDADPNAQNMEVLIAVAQEDMINAHVDTVMSAKLVPAAIDVEPLAISRALADIAGDTFADQTLAVVHMGATSTMILVMRKSLLSFVRSIPTAGEALTQAIRQNFMGDEKLSEQVKRQFADLSEDGQGGAAQLTSADDDMGALDDGGVLAGDEVDSVFELSDAAAPDVAGQALGADAGATQVDVAEPGEVAIPPAAPPGRATPDSPADVVLGEDELAARQIIYEAIAPGVVDLATEIRRSIDFYRRQHRNEEVDRIIVSGGSAQIAGIGPFIEAETGISTSIADPFEHLSVDESVAPRQFLTDVGPSMVVAVGLALRDMLE